MGMMRNQCEWSRGGGFGDQSPDGLIKQIEALFHIMAVHHSCNHTMVRTPLINLTSGVVSHPDLKSPQLSTPWRNSMAGSSTP
jgi:hypothetical protein